MPRLRVLSTTEQTVAYLRAELLRGRWRGLMPGGDRLAAELAIGRGAVEMALQQLEKEGFLLNQGRRRGRLIVLPGGETARPMQVGIMHFERSDRFVSHMVDLQYALAAAGHTITFSSKSLIDLDMDLARIKRLVKQSEVDAWVVMAGSREVLEWFAVLGTPTFALFGRRNGLSLAAAGPDKHPAMTAATRALLAYGHKRIVLLTRRIRRLPQPGVVEQKFLNELSAHGLSVGDYNLPDWEESIDGFYARLETLFRMTPPTALIVDEARFFVATQQFLATKGLRAPQNISLVCTDADPAFEWCRPAVSHIRWDSRPVVRRIVRWADNVSRGKRDVRQTLTPAEFVRGETIGPAHPVALRPV